MLFRNKTSDLSVDKTIKLEKDLENSILAQIGYKKQDEVLAKEFNLEILVDDKLPEDVEAVLDEPTLPTPNGVVRIKSKYVDNHFSFIHEIMHYVFDVGTGNKVKMQYARNVKGKTKDPREQEINYLTAAYQLPYAEMKNKLKEFNNSYPKDELKFVAGLCDEYKQPREAVLRRIREVKRIAARRNESL